ncbi:hypothetical protein ACROYT_G026392 [Oculina patagonica]
MLKQENIRCFLVLYTVFIGCCHQGTAVSIKAQELFPENPLCAWNGEGCAENNEKDDFRQEYDDNEDVFDETENAIGELRDIEDTADTESASDNWRGKLQAPDGMLEEKNSGDSYNRANDGKGGACPSDWIHLQDSCYKFFNSKVTWNTAKSACEGLGSNLVAINSQAELQALASKIPDAFMWIGLYRDPKDKSRWLWSDGSQVTYTHWAKGEPNGLHEECGEMRSKRYRWEWNDLSCSYKYPYVCETRSTRVSKCPALTVGRLVKTSPSNCVTSQMNINTKCSFSCPQGYQLQGPSYKQCAANGQWTDSAKSVLCIVVKCPALTVGGLVKTSPSSCVTSQMTYNTTCSFSCPQGYQLQGPSYKKCVANGNWTDGAKSVSCIVVKCPALTVGGLVKTSPSSCVTSQMNYDTKCLFSCPQGYQLQGPSYKQCGANGNWTDNAKSVLCIVVKCPVLTVGRLVKTSPSSCVTSQMNYDTTCSFSCPQGYQLQGPSYKQCEANGQWTESAKSVSCIVVKCPALTVGGLVKTSPNSCVTSQMTYNTTCSFLCPQGYQLQGPSYKQCGANGNWTNSAKSVSCIVVKCPALTVGRLVKTSPSSCVTSQMKINTTCSFSCPQGYQLQGPSYKQCKANGNWTNSAKSVSCNVIKCPALTVGRLVKTSPSNCVTSQMKYNTTCSFLCPQGYQLQGPSYKQCVANGNWTNSAKSVSCTDIDECAVSNGGCSHKCVNTAGGYKCECPDPELSLLLDNKTCHAPGVDVQCNRDNMTIIIPKSLLRGIDREHLRLLDTKCKAEETSAHFSLTTPLTGCNTTRRHTPTAIVYSNTVLEIPVAAEDVVTRVREIEIQFSCFYSKYGVVSSVGWKPSNRKLVFSDEGKGNFKLSLNMFSDKRFVSPYTKDDFPVAVVLRKLLFFEVSVTSGDKQLSIIAERCFATPTQDHKNPLKYEFITKGCPSDVTVKYHSAPSVSAQRFSLEAFKFIADHPFAFVHCHVIVCNATDPDSQCAKKCPSSGRGRRAVNDHVTDVYSLAQGPLHLAREKRDEKRDNGLHKSVSSPTFLMALFVVCVAFLAGTALMIFKKSRDKPENMRNDRTRT